MGDTSNTTAKTSRLVPASWRELQTVAAIFHWPKALERFRDLGLPPLFFEHEGCRAVAAWVLTGATEPMPAHVQILMTIPEKDNFMVLADAIELFRQSREEWALHDIDRHATAYAARWLPAYLRYWADQVERGEANFQVAAMQIDTLLSLVRPLVLAGVATKEAA